MGVGKLRSFVLILAWVGILALVFLSIAIWDKISKWSISVSVAIMRE